MTLPRKVSRLLTLALTTVSFHDAFATSHSDGLIETNPGYAKPKTPQSNSGAARRKPGSKRKEKRLSAAIAPHDDEGEETEQHHDILSGRDGDSSDDEYDTDHGCEYDDTDVDEEGADDAKSRLSSALASSRKAPRSTLRLLKTHRSQITLALALFAFRREIYSFLAKILSSAGGVDPGTGKRRPLRIRPTSVLKIILFVDLMRKLQSSSSGSNGRNSPVMAALLAGGGGPGGVLGLALTDLLKPGNPAYIPPIEQHYTFERLNERHDKDGMAYKKAMGIELDRSEQLGRGTSAGAGGRWRFRHSVGKGALGAGNYTNGTVVVMDMTGLGSSVASMETIRDQVTFLLTQHRSNNAAGAVPGTNNATSATDFNNTAGSASNVAIPAEPHATDSAPNSELEIIILLESPGGSASDYGLAAQQIGRLRNEPGVRVTICVDKVAASGGYMMACMSSPGRLYAAPFAVVGSIGVIGQSLNIHNTLQNWGVKPLVFRGGKDKAPVGMIGEVTKEGLAKVQGMVDKTHAAFKRHVAEARPAVAKRIDEVATGDVWLGTDAVDVGLVDRLVTSDEYVGERVRDGARVLKLVKHKRARFPFGGPPHPGYGSPLHLGGPISSLRGKFESDLRRITSKLADFLDDFPRKSEDLASGATARALGVANAQTIFSGIQPASSP